MQIIPHFDKIIDYLTKRVLRKYTNLSRNFEPASEEYKISVFFLSPLL